MVTNMKRLEAESAMVVGVMRLDLHLLSCFSIKDKRKILRSLIDRARVRFHVAIAEVGDNDIWGRAQVGASVVSNDRQHANSVLNKVLETAEGTPGVEVLDTSIEILSL